MKRRRTWISLTFVLALMFQAVFAAPSSAGGGTFTLNTWPPALNANNNVFAKAQTKVLTGFPNPDKIGVVVCVVAWDGSEYFQLSTCVKDSARNTNQITRNKTIAGGCNPGVRYGTKARGWIDDANVIYFAPGPFAGNFLFNPPSGGVQLC